MINAKHSRAVTVCSAAAAAAPEAPPAAAAAVLPSVVALALLKASLTSLFFARK